jgi:hypothetical protein
VKAKLYTGKGAKTRPDTVHGHVHYVTVGTDHYNKIIIKLIKSLYI